MRQVGGRGWATLARGTFLGFPLALLLSCGCGQARRPSPVTHRVEIRAMRFDPALVQAAIGDSVRWTNRDLVPHTVTSRAGAFDSGNLPPDSSWTIRIASDGPMDYSCAYHPIMEGRIVAGSSRAPAAGVR